MASRVQWRKFAFFERDTLLESLNELLVSNIVDTYMCICMYGLWSRIHITLTGWVSHLRLLRGRAVAIR